MSALPYSSGYHPHSYQEQSNESYFTNFATQHPRRSLQPPLSLFILQGQWFISARLTMSSQTISPSRPLPITYLVPGVFYLVKLIFPDFINEPSPLKPSKKSQPVPCVYYGAVTRAPFRRITAQPEQRAVLQGMPGGRQLALYRNRDHTRLLDCPGIELPSH